MAYLLSFGTGSTFDHPHRDEGVSQSFRPSEVLTRRAASGMLANVYVDPERRRVLIPQALGADEYLRVTWHEQRRVMVFSHWQGDHCVAATPIRVSDLGELAELTVTALARSLPVTSPSDWPAPTADELVATTLVA